MDTENYENDNVSEKTNNDFKMFGERYISESKQDINWNTFFDMHPYSFSNEKRNPYQMSGIQYFHPTSVIRKPNICESKNTCDEEKKCNECRTASEPFCHVNLDSILKLKNSTKKLLHILEEIQSKTSSKIQMHSDPIINGLNTAIPSTHNIPSATDLIGANAIKRLEDQAKNFEGIYIEDDDDDCSVYKRLVRKCHCLNRYEYNDFIIHFNEDTKYFTSTIGEIIKNMKILKKFLYMGGEYAKNALLFLNEGLSNSTHTEKVEIINGISHADVCNVFEDYSIVTVHISWPCKYENYGDRISQSLAAGLLNKLAQLEEGRRYLKFSTKLTNDIKKVLRKKAAKLDFDILESLNATLNLLHPPLSRQVNVTYYCKPIDEGFGKKTAQALIHYRQYMTLDEVFTHLDILHNLSNKDHSKMELASSLPSLLNLFIHMLMEYDNSEMNIIVTNILNNIVTKNVIKENEPEVAKNMTIANIATEPIKMKNESNQIPAKKNNQKKNNKSKLGLNTVPNKFHQLSKRKVSERESSHFLNNSKKFTKDNRNSIIVVPIDE